ncbi:MAG TPA: peptidoglycan DD-metalloendopeptidase family protein [Bacteroidales bacterium]|jgi:septal ring factor EnvC (AmiA/AmiB activator)|nr:peptidoglycan DD-metalloendopeptidase family protein [Bacteroidales bacterium]HPB88952.1 peptidoglycan DD-metalloendopeptidase family protein [Bacteroidales bacterium]HPY21813.1 peptidoglycan DD-metalloendopeptidase family protein [Bacteroidales bacterium]HQA93287.1 peptidoglycan DD-metalloendopeptidase family protein [Bacteroidales bacterium]HQN23861.1 peptidoglycan DD-metalloendopeptidase family protein [Bacteroidales bacterium]
MKRLLLILVLLLPFSSLSAQDTSRQSEQKKRLEEEIEFINKQLKEILSKEKASTLQLTLISRKISNRKAIIEGIDKEIAEIGRNINAKNHSIRTLQREIDTLESYYARLVRNTYKNRDTKVWFMYLFASESLGQGYRRFSYLKNLADVVNAQGVKIKEKQAQLEREKKELENMKKKAEATRAEREQEYKELLREETISRQVADNLAKSRKQQMRELERKRRQVEKLNREIESILSKAVKTQQKEKTPIDYTLSGMFEQNKGKLPWPVAKGVVIGKYGVHYHPVYKNLKLPENNGIDISTSRNAEVLCVFDGVVKQIIMMPGYNQCVLIQHGTYFTFYCKLKKVNVKTGDKVATGEPIGILNEEGNTSELHFQIWKGTTKQNPAVWLRPR